jgi:hypothetical protein
VVTPAEGTVDAIKAVMAKAVRAAAAVRQYVVDDWNDLSAFRRAYDRKLRAWHASGCQGNPPERAVVRVTESGKSEVIYPSTGGLFGFIRGLFGAGGGLRFPRW